MGRCVCTVRKQTGFETAARRDSRPVATRRPLQEALIATGSDPSSTDDVSSEQERLVEAVLVQPASHIDALSLRLEWNGGGNGSSWLAVVVDPVSRTLLMAPFEPSQSGQ